MAPTGSTDTALGQQQTRPTKPASRNPLARNPFRKAVSPANEAQWLDYGVSMPIREARAADVDQILAMICELADYEREPNAVRATREGLAAALFGPHPGVFCLLAEPNDPDPRIAGFALYFLSFSTWEGVHGIHLEDLYVRPAFRGGGYGGALLHQLARIATEHGYARMEWTVLDWNQSAIDFYDRIGARSLTEWLTYRLSGEALACYAAE